MKTKVLFYSLIIITIVLVFAGCSNSNTNNSNESSNNDTIEQTATPQSSTMKDMKDKDADELLIMRNKIFARYGYKFKNIYLLHYFSQFDWYKPTHDNVDKMLTEIDNENLDIIIEAENKLIGKDVTFESLLTLFDDISNKTISLNGDEPIEIGKNIDDIYLRKYFELNTDEMGEDCRYLRLSAVGMFYIAETNDLALICYERICPIPAVYLEYPLFVFDLDGKMYSEFRLAFNSGDVSDLTHAEAKIDNGNIIKYVKHDWWDEERRGAGGEPYVVNDEYTIEVIYDSKSHMFVQD
jgi:YARHG domain